jgi:mono/diheme cytochrome c family protein
MKKMILIGLGAAVVLGLLIQVVPVDRQNPAVVTQVSWDSAETQALWTRACADCHSNETTWPWYSYVAPISWLVAHDVEEGRGKFNISALDANRLDKLSREISEVVGEGEMPMPIYLITHPEARLTSAEQETLIKGLQETLVVSSASR